MKLQNYIERHRTPACSRRTGLPEGLVKACCNASGGDYLLAIDLALQVLSGTLSPPSGRKDQRPDGGG